MGKAPTTIVIARHGARLDAADKNWHLTSPTPYDPPLSYGGWLQSRALGARIISLLDSHSNSTSPVDSLDAVPESKELPPKKKRRVIIHTSPYLRCLQTAIAVSSGISQYSSSSNSVQQAKGSYVGSATQPEQRLDNKKIAKTNHSHADGNRCLLRVDAFLGEWLCPDYFDVITPPPNSDRLIAAAKAELLRRGDSIVPQADTNGRPSTGYFPGGWGSFSTPASPESGEEGKPGPKPSANYAQNQRNRADSYDVLDSTNTPRAKGLLSKINTNLSSLAGGYVPPTPSYAISPSDPIPAGYVTHARNACMKIDYQWDSMRKPQNWGNGGEYGEEWSSMHTRFRNGLENMLEWYQEDDEPINSIRPLSYQDGRSNGIEPVPEDGDALTETVLVLITHGAGCNALIGALTNEPVLLDIGTASLTMAVRKDADDKVSLTDSTGEVREQRRRSPSELSMAQEYRLKLVASTDHLRAGANPAQIPSALPSPTTVIAPSIQPQRHRLTSRDPSLSPGPFIIGPSSLMGSSSKGWSWSRPSTASRISPGLWGTTSPGPDPETESPIDDLVPNFGDSGGVKSTPSVKETSIKSEAKVDEPAAWEKQLPQRTMSQRGLWGSAPLNKEREAGVKRRWTVTERRA
ncbi:hypothetical protein ASPWEDRAFT_166136 [Aspergillus wentii DTO 134E9]|uniref:Phosphoglycerate mutase family protein n=1 Tax=Aspergillus wentii DTO 134E9 TaxID=1073089 RepID=A0A1L9RYP2_ASPWE|nr:uncharacterized protein ASPWEDRAFT_166136 [Aspergillus wentii DTO 134E9]KAI9932482.1 hypothetical protein MW887_008723 [Aspergillus wentii]OJJ40049.1 hypothetical protein ASPWEDRAFT_166136 [Aspergillus wentii DTO 134E9]